MISRKNESASDNSAVIQDPCPVSRLPPSPWRVESPDGDARGRWLLDANNSYIGLATIHESNAEVAVASVFAAAPDMLSSLRELLDIVTEHDKLQYPKGSPIDHTITRARQIIAKAGGKP